MECGRCQLVDWADLQGQLNRVPDKLRSALDKVFSKRRKQRVFHVRYPYGQLIIDKGRFVPPCGVDLCQTCRLLAEETQYSQIPLALLLKNPVEVFNEYFHEPRYDFRFAPIRLIPEGELLGVFEVLDALMAIPSPRPGWSVSSGARSVWVLAPLGSSDLPTELASVISEQTRRKVRINWRAEKILEDETETNRASGNPRFVKQPHWSLIQECAAHTALVGQDQDEKPWFTELIVFPGGMLTSSDRSSELFTEMLTIGWKYSAALRQASIEDTAIRSAVTRTAIELPGGPMHHIAAMRHFWNVMTGTMPAYKSCHVIEEPAGPFRQFCKHLEKALGAIHPRGKNSDADGKLSSYRPIVMQPHHLKHGEAGFYSCRCPSIPGPEPPKPERFLDLPQAYRDVIRNFRGEYSKSMNLHTMTLFSMPAHDKKGPIDLPDDITPIHNIELRDFFREPLPKGGSGAVFLKSPFLMSCIRLTGQSHQGRASDLLHTAPSGKSSSVARSGG
jgi:hypothetical protein